MKAAIFHRRSSSVGSSLVELLLALPFVVLLGLVLLQTALVFQAHHSLSYAFFEAARQGSVQGGRASAVEAGFANGLVAFLSPSAHSADPLAARSFSERESLLEAARAHVRAGVAGQWIEIRRISPTPLMFAEWGEPARDDNGAWLDGTRVIPSDNLKYRSLARADAASLADATLLKLELRYGTPLLVPFVGAFMTWLMRQHDGCSAIGERRIGLLRVFGERGDGAVWRCRFYQGADEQGRNRHRWPIRLSATIRMQSPTVQE